MKVLNWILRSSADPQKVSLTVKSIGGVLVSVLAVLGLGLSLDVPLLDVNGDDPGLPLPQGQLSREEVSFGNFHQDRGALADLQGPRRNDPRLLEF